MARDPVLAKQREATRKRLVGKPFMGSTIVKIGTPVDKRLNCPPCVPVQLKNGKYAVVWNEEKDGALTALESDNPKIERMFSHSRQMPDVKPGIGSGVMYLWIYPRNQNVKYAFCKIYYNDKVGRGDSYQEVTWAEDARNRREKMLAEEDSSAT